MKSNLMKLIAAFLVAGWSCYAADFYVAPGGSDGNPGTLSSPFGTLTKAVDVAGAGDFIYLRGGTYSVSSSLVINKNGTSGSPIRVFAYNGESPVLQFNNVVSSSNRGVVLNGDYWHWRGITIERAGDNGMLLSGNYNTIENCVFRRNNDSGLQLSRYNTEADQISEWPSYNTIVGCEAYDNSDPDHEDADGFAAKLTCGVGNVFRDCISHHNIDDGWDLYTKSETGPIGIVVFENCIAHNNGTLTDGSTSGGGDKNGFKLGSSAHNINHELRRCIAFNNGKHGFTDNGNVGNIKFYNLTSYNNGDYNYHVRDGASHTFRNCVTFQGNHTDRIVGDAPVSCNALDDTDFNWTYITSASDFQTLTPGPNHAPTSNGFLHLSGSSSFIDAGCSASGISGNGTPDLGAIEYGGTPPPPPPPPPGTTYTLSTAVSGSGTVSGGGTYDENTTATITAFPASGWSFSNWTGDASGTSSTTTLFMDGDKSVTAVFTQDGSTPPPGGSGDQDHNFTESGLNSSFYSISGNLSTTKGTVNYNGMTLTQCLKIESSTSITFTSVQDGSLTLVFNEGWSGGFVVDGTSRSVSGGILTVDLAAGAHSLSKDDVANLYYMSLTYDGTTPPPPQSYTLSTSVTGQGSVSGAGTYNEGTTVTLTATAASGWEFSGWSGVDASNGNTATVTMNSNRSISASFTEISTPPPSNSIVLQENNTGFCGVDGSVDNNNGGFSGDGFANTDNASGTGIDWTINGNGGTYTFRWRFANGSSTNRTGVLYLNGTAFSTEDFQGTGSWTSWTTTSVTLNNVPSGFLNVRLEANQSSGLANIDYLEVEGAGVAAADCDGSTPPPATYTLSTSVTGQGMVSGAGTYDAGTVVNLMASAASGWEIDSWNGVDASNGNTATVTMNSSRSVSVVFTEISSPPPSGNITIRARGVQGGEQIQLLAGGNVAGTWTLTTGFANYTAQGTGDVQVYFINDNGSFDVQIDYVMIDGVTLQAEDQAVNTGVWSGTCGGSYSEWLHCNGYIDFGGTTPPPDTYTLSTNVYGQGNVTGAGTYEAGTVVTLSATPATGWQFDNWGGAAGGTSPTTTVTVNSNLSVSAYFSEIPQSTELTLQEGQTGFCAVDGDIESEHSGYTGSGYANTENAAGTGVDYSVNVVSGGTYTVEVRYAATSDRPADLIQNGATVGGLSLPQSGAWDSYTTQSTSVYLSAGVSTLRLEATGGSGLPNIDYLQLTGPGIAAADCNGTEPPPQTYTLNVSVSGSGSVSPNGGTYSAGEVVTLTASPGMDYVFSNWSGDASGSSSTTMVTMDSDKSVTAVFTYNGGGSGGSDVNFALAGWATENGGTTGGQGGPVVTVSSGQELQDAIDMGGPRVIFVQGTITDAPDGKINVKDVSDISILGAGNGAEFNGIGIKIWRASNIIIRNLRIHHVTQGDKDCISIEGPSDHIWIDHCELYAEYQGVDKDYYDGLLDAKGEAEYITYSWNHLHDSWKTSLVGSSESDDYDRKITMHHNFYENCNSRLPLFRGGNGHIFNCYYKDNVSTTINSRIGACIRVENNYFENSNNPWVSAYSDVLGGVDVSGNILVNSPFDYSNSDVNEALSCNAWVPYTYSSVLNSTEDVPSIVQQYAGVGKLSDPASFTTAKAADAVITGNAEPTLGKLKAYPNPFSGSTTISFELQKSQEVAFSLMDYTGRVVDIIEMTSYPAGENHITYNNAALQPGVYLLTVQYGNTIENVRLVVH